MIESPAIIVVRGMRGVSGEGGGVVMGGNREGGEAVRGGGAGEESGGGVSGELTILIDERLTADFSN